MPGGGMGHSRCIPHPQCKQWEKARHVLPPGAASPLACRAMGWKMDTGCNSIGPHGWAQGTWSLFPRTQQVPAPLGWHSWVVLHMALSPRNPGVLPIPKQLLLTPAPVCPLPLAPMNFHSPSLALVSPTPRCAPQPSAGRGGTLAKEVRRQA